MFRKPEAWLFPIRSTRYVLDFELSARGYEVSYLLVPVGSPVGAVAGSAESLPLPPPHPTKRTVPASTHSFFKSGRANLIIFPPGTIWKVFVALIFPLILFRAVEHALLDRFIEPEQSCCTIG